MPSDDTQYLLELLILLEFLLLVTCKMTLILGPPGAGKTTFLLVFSGKLDKALKVEFLFFLMPLRGSFP
jgi:ABC-type hemin transport system ATPase subunit